MGTVREGKGGVEEGGGNITVCIIKLITRNQTKIPQNTQNMLGEGLVGYLRMRPGEIKFYGGR